VAFYSLISFFTHLLICEQMLESFSYGEEFLRLNFEALEAYSACRDSADVARCQGDFQAATEAKKALKEERLARERERDARSDNIGGYMDDMDLPPIDSDAESYEEERVLIEELRTEPEVAGGSVVVVDESEFLSAGPE